MKKFLRINLQIALCIMFIFQIEASGMSDPKETALLLIDIQNFYFPGGNWELVNPEKACFNAQKLLTKFRENKNIIVHIRHNAEPGGEIHKLVQPLQNELVISKNSANCFKDTELYDYLIAHQIKKLVICGMMTHMCVEAATRAGSDYGFECLVVGDACATRAVEFNGKKVSAEDVHISTLSTISGSYAKVMDVEKFLTTIDNL